MIYLKEFNTTEEYNAFVESGQMKRPNVSLVNEPFTTYYNKYIPLGVFIQHVDGTLFTEADWTSAGFGNDVANGVAVVTDNARFVIAKTDVSANKSWSSNYLSLVDGIMTTGDKATAKTDFAGYNNTQLMLATDTSGAGYSCANFTFPNGAKGYLPSIGEWNEAYANKSKIDSVMTTIGGDTITLGGYWSSSQYNATMAWLFDWKWDSIGNLNKRDAYYVRAFTSLPL